MRRFKCFPAMPLRDMPFKCGLWHTIRDDPMKVPSFFAFLLKIRKFVVSLRQREVCRLIIPQFSLLISINLSPFS